MSRPTPKQWETLNHRLGRSMRLLYRLRCRLEQLRMSPRSRYYQAACKAYNAVHSLSVQTHYASCTHGVANEDESLFPPPEPEKWLGDGI